MCIRDSFLTAIANDRESLVRVDAFRSLVFISLAFGVLWLFMKGSLKKQIVPYILAGVFFIDLFMVDWRYMNHKEFVPKKKESADDFVNVPLAHILHILETGYNLSSSHQKKKISRSRQSHPNDECMKLAHYVPPWRNYNVSAHSRELHPVVRATDVCDIPNTLSLIKNAELASHIDPRCLVCLPRDRYDALCSVSNNFV